MNADRPGRAPGGLRLRSIRADGLGPVDLLLARGERVCLRGASGAGKSRLLRAIADLDPHEGQMWLDEVPRDSISGSDWRRRVGLLPAEPRWWHERIADHYPRVDGTLLDALQRLSLPRTVLDTAPGELSSGERQRLALLRLLANEPSVLLLDEPTANLDAEAAARVESLVRERPATTLWVTHDPAQVERVAERVVHIAAGRLVEDRPLGGPTEGPRSDVGSGFTRDAD